MFTDFFAYPITTKEITDFFYASRIKKGRKKGIPKLLRNIYRSSHSISKSLAQHLSTRPKLEVKLPPLRPGRRSRLVLNQKVSIVVYTYIGGGLCNSHHIIAASFVLLCASIMGLFKL